MSITRTVIASSVVSMCVSNNYYSCGTISDYSKMLDSVNERFKDNWPDDEILNLATDIFNHSDVDKKCLEFGCCSDEVFSNLIFLLLNDCCCYFYDV